MKWKWRQRGRVVRAMKLKSRGRRFKSRSDLVLGRRPLFTSSVVSQMVCLPPVGIFKPIMCFSLFCLVDTVVSFCLSGMPVKELFWGMSRSAPSPDKKKYGALRDIPKSFCEGARLGVDQRALTIFFAFLSNQHLLVTLYPYERSFDVVFHNESLVHETVPHTFLSSSSSLLFLINLHFTVGLLLCSRLFSVPHRR